MNSTERVAARFLLPERVAFRFLAKEYAPADAELIRTRFRNGVKNFIKQFDGLMNPVTFEPTQPGHEYEFNGRTFFRPTAVPYSWAWQWGHLIADGAVAAKWAVETRAIPGGKAKAFELAARLFLSAKRKPSDPYEWLAKNNRHINLMLEALDWPERGTTETDGLEEVFKLGSFKVHNTMHLEGQKLATTKEVIEKAERFIRSSGVPEATKVLYGDILVVGKLRQPRTLAWYYTQTDEVYLRPHLKVGRGEVHNLVHELGHRLWNKFLGTARKGWISRHTELSYLRTAPVELPKVGEPLMIPIRGRDTPPIIQAYEPKRDGNIWAVLDGGGLIRRDVIYKALQTTARQANFPTPYAATSVEEHFAEAFAMYCLGTLPDNHRIAFDNIMAGVYRPAGYEGLQPVGTNT